MTIPLSEYENYFFIDNGVFMELSYYAATIAMDHLTIYSGMTFGNTNILETDVIGWNRAADLIDTKADINAPTFTGQVRLETAPSRTDVSLRVATAGFVQNLWNNIAPVEITMKATKNYSIGDYVYIQGFLYKVTATVASGASFTVGTNIVATTVMDEIKTLINEAINS